MSAIEFWKTFFEFVAVMCLIIGFVNEKKVIAFEVALARSIRQWLKARKNRKKRFTDILNTIPLEEEQEFTQPYVTTYDTWKNRKGRGGRYEQ